MRYLSLAEALLIAEAVTGIDAATFARVCRLELLDSALHAPRSGFGDEDFYPGFVEKAALLVVRVACNHPLPDRNKRLAWQALTMFCALNGHDLVATLDAAVTMMVAVAAGELDEVRSRLGSPSISTTDHDALIRPPRSRTGAWCGRS